MQSCFKLLKMFGDDDSGATAIEYGLIAGLMAVACITAFGLLGGSVMGLFGTVSNEAGTSISNASSSMD